MHRMVLITRRFGMFIAAVVGLAIVCPSWTVAQTSTCKYYKVQAKTLNVTKAPSDDSVFIDLLDKGDVVCVTREQESRGRKWAYTASKVVSVRERAPVEGWVNQQQLQSLTPAEVAVITGAPLPPPATGTPPASGSDDVIRFSQPLTFGPFPVNGSSLEQLAESVPQFSPIAGLDEQLWKKNCSSCHQWNRQALCQQGGSYAKNPRNALRQPHPFGGAYKSALMQWAKSGCQ